MYHVTIDGSIVFATKRHLFAILRYRMYHFLFPCLEILIDYDGIICD